MSYNHADAYIEFKSERNSWLKKHNCEERDVLGTLDREYILVSEEDDEGHLKHEKVYLPDHLQVNAE